jgi:hypothetical protein
MSEHSTHDDADVATDAAADREALLRRLDELEAQSNARRDELKAIAAQLPETISRRALLRAVIDDLRYSPQKGAIAKRAAYKAARAPMHAAKRVQVKLRLDRSA